MNRRMFLKAASTLGAGAAISSLPFINSCKGANPTGPEEPPEPSVPVNLKFDVFNHTQGLMGTFSRDNVMSGTGIVFYASGLIFEHGIQNVVNNKLALRTKNFGSLITYSKEGSVTLTVPRTDTEYGLFLFNNAGADLYNWYDTVLSKGIVYSSNQLEFYRKDYDGLTGEERVWGGELLPETGDYGVFDQINNALKPEWASFKYGFIERLPTGTNGDSSYGFGSGYGREFWKSAHDYVVVNPTRLTTIPQQVAGGIAAVIESLMGWEDLGGGVTYKPIQDNGVLNQAGKDIIAFMFVRDPAARKF